MPGDEGLLNGDRGTEFLPQGKDDYAALDAGPAYIKALFSGPGCFEVHNKGGPLKAGQGNVLAHVPAEGEGRLMDVARKYPNDFATIGQQGANECIHFVVIPFLAEVVGDMAEQNDWFHLPELRIHKGSLLLGYLPG
jgi:hypothetical protein